MNDTHRPPNWWEDDASDSPPYNQPATANDINRWQTEYPTITEERYVHFPDRREQRLMPTPETEQWCMICNGIVLPYAPGRCPDCSRIIAGGMSPPPPHLPICSCYCACPPEQDDPTDADWVPDNHDHAEEQSPTDSGDLDSSEGSDVGVYGYGGLQDHRGQWVLRQYHQETGDHYNAATARQLPTDAESSLFNANNTVHPDEASNLYRPPFRMENLRLLDMGYTRDEIRANFHETRDGRLTSYIPADFRLADVDFPRTCPVCFRDYGDSAYEALRFNHVVCHERAILRNEGHRYGWDSNRDLLRRITGRDDLNPVFMNMCYICNRPFRAPNYLRDQPHHCACRCDCHDPGIMGAPSSSSSSGRRSSGRMSSSHLSAGQLSANQISAGQMSSGRGSSSQVSSGRMSGISYG